MAYYEYTLAFLRPDAVAIVGPGGEEAAAGLAGRGVALDLEGDGGALRAGIQVAAEGFRRAGYRIADSRDAPWETLAAAGEDPREPVFLWAEHAGPAGATPGIGALLERAYVLAAPEGSAGMRAVLAGPGLPPGRRLRLPLSVADIACTLLDCCGVLVPEGGPGRSRKPDLESLA